MMKSSVLYNENMSGNPGTGAQWKSAGVFQLPGRGRRAALLGRTTPLSHRSIAMPCMGIYVGETVRNWCCGAACLGGACVVGSTLPPPVIEQPLNTTRS